MASERAAGRASRKQQAIPRECEMGRGGGRGEFKAGHMDRIDGGVGVVGVVEGRVGVG